MPLPTNKKIVFISVPPTFVEERLCPLGFIPIGILKIISFLKKRNNETVFINMHSGVIEDRSMATNKPRTVWKNKRMGLNGSRYATMSVEGKDTLFLEEQLRNLPFKPDEIWISCSFSFDYDLVKEYVDISKKLYPSTKTVVGGDFARAGYGVGRMTGADEVCETRIPEADSCLPDFSCVDEWGYGLFQLQIGCVNKCSFCHINMDKPQFYDNQKIIAYMKEFYAAHKPYSFMNWDPNVALNRKQLTDFLERYYDSGMKSALAFGKGLQPNLVNDDMMRLMAKARVNSVTIPMESASYEAMKRLSKPYTIISSIKLLESARNAGISMRDCRCTSLLGYPDDDLHSFFRIYLTILAFGATPSPFPVYLFPGAPDYVKYKDALKDKDISEFHGQLWPLMPDEKIDDYLCLYRFIELTDLSSIQKNVSLLSPEMRNALSDEAGKFRKFIDMCLNSKKDSFEEFNRINSEVESSTAKMPASAKKETTKKACNKKRLLCIIANTANPRRSVSKAMGEYYLSAYLKANPGAEIEKLYLPGEGLTFINEEYVDAVYYKDDSRQLSPETRNLMDLAEKYSEKLRMADEILIVTPMYTMSIPAVLKAFFETVASYSYYYNDKKLFDAKDVICLISRDGSYERKMPSASKESPFINTQETVIAAALGFLGLSKNPDFIDISGLGARENLPKAIIQAKKRIDLYIRGDKKQAYTLF